jgi:glutaredoxin
MTVEPIQLTLYGKPDCGLCDELKAMLAELQSESRFVLREQNILEDPAAYERYRSWVPVLEIEGGLRLYPPHSWEKLRSVLAPPVPPPLNDA